MDKKHGNPHDFLRRRRWLVSATALVWTCAIGASLLRYRLAAKASVTLVLSTSPSAVRLTLNGEKFADGAYVETPLRIPVASGKTRIKISRDGYVPHLVSVEGETGDTYRMEGVVLQKKSDADFSRLAIQTTSVARGLFVDVDEGFARGEVPLIVEDLAPTRTHTLAIYPNWPEKTPVVRCQVPSRQKVKLDEPHIVKIRQSKKGRLTFEGCLADKTPRS